MRKFRGGRLFCIILGFVALPSVIAVAAHMFTDDPTLRPLGITQEKLDERSPVGRIEIVAYIRWNTARERVTKEAFGNAIIRAFDAKNMTPRLEITEVSGQHSIVTYQIGPSRVGPFPTSAAAHGIEAASAAYRNAIAHARRVQKQ